MLNSFRRLTQQVCVVVANLSLGLSITNSPFDEHGSFLISPFICYPFEMLAKKDFPTLPRFIVQHAHQEGTSHDSPFY